MDRHRNERRDTKKSNMHNSICVHVTVKQIKESVNAFCSICSIICWVCLVQCTNVYKYREFIQSHTVSIGFLGKKAKKSEKISKIAGCWYRRSTICFRYRANVMHLIYPEPDAHAQQNNKIIHKININNSHHRSSFITPTHWQKVLRTVNNNWWNHGKGEKNQSVYSHFEIGIWFHMNHTHDDSNEEGLQRIIVCALWPRIVRPGSILLNQ